MRVSLGSIAALALLRAVRVYVSLPFGSIVFTRPLKHMPVCHLKLDSQSRLGPGAAHVLLFDQCKAECPRAEQVPPQNSRETH